MPFANANILTGSAFWFLRSVPGFLTFLLHQRGPGGSLYEHKLSEQRPKLDKRNLAAEWSRDGKIAGCREYVRTDFKWRRLWER